MRVVGIFMFITCSLILGRRRRNAREEGIGR